MNVQFNAVLISLKQLKAQTFEWYSVLHAHLMKPKLVCTHIVS